MHLTAKHPHYPTIPPKLFYGATNTSVNPGSCVEGFSTPPNITPMPPPPAPLHTPHVPDLYVNHVQEPFRPIYESYTYQAPQLSYTQAHGDSCLASLLSAPPALTAWPSMPGIRAWISGVSNGPINSCIPPATCSDSSESLAGSTPSTVPSAIPPVPTTKSKNAKMGTQACEDFPIQDLDQLLCVVIQVNPYLAAHKWVGEKWREVMRVVQEGGFCQGRDADTLKNKVVSLLQWVENSSQVLSRTALRHEAASDPATFASLSGHLDKVASMRREAKDLSDNQREGDKKEKDADRVAGEELRAAMMNTQHGKTKCMCCNGSPSPSNKENTSGVPSVQAESTSDSHSSEVTSSKCARILPLLCVGRSTEAVLLMKAEQESADKFHVTVVKSTQTALELQQRGIEVAEHALQQQANFQNTLLEVLVHGVQTTK
ncbi:hypothetical protein K439DRAFT_1615161 [Ramaria rubella]|nr:hypothetical protein K439DRAFT_1615161 [Ramaria rubella]